MIIPMEPTPAEEIAELRSMAADWQRQCHQLEAAIIAAGGTTEYGDHGETVVTWPTVKREYGIRHRVDLDISARTEFDARFWACNYPKSYCLISRTAPGPWQDS